MSVSAHPSGAQWMIRHGAQEAVVVQVGGGLRRWRVNDTDLLDGYDQDELCPASAGQVLAPWPNRVRDGSYQFDGVSYQLPLSEPAHHNAIHGLVQWLPWTLVDSSPSAVTCECILPAQPGYPWTLRLRTRWSVTQDGLAGEHWATNLAATPAPFGFAVHPYLRLPGVAVSDLELQVPGQTRLLTDGRSLPVGMAKVSGTEWDFTAARRIGAQQLDIAYGSLMRDAEGGSTVTLRGPNGATIGCWADRAFGWWQVFTGDGLPAPRQRRAVAVEPMTCPPDALRSGRDLVTLTPGTTWHATWRLHARLA